MKVTQNATVSVKDTSKTQLPGVMPGCINYKGHCFALLYRPGAAPDAKTEFESDEERDHQPGPRTRLPAGDRPKASDMRVLQLNCLALEVRTDPASGVCLRAFNSIILHLHNSSQ